ncbi:XRE family transcriptional regulator [Streptomyces sp. AV19]|nr:helix-turn-helix transcriptional regulator [Streptomyces sp. AV19]MBH1936481.1 XRE family transcriptional regulator [Streptomyces sp. AV19]MDG4532537.1 helix-turn-helix domain-containing protein [Streptomyces sp. AV19]
MARRNAGSGSVATAPETFGELLKHYREAAGLTQARLAKRLLCERSVLARIEAGKRPPSEDVVRACDRELGTGGALLKLWRRIDWYPDVEHPDWFNRRAEMDAEAESLHEYQNQVMPGLLQTEDYARALFSHRGAETDLDVVERLVRARLSRQQRFLRSGGPLLVVVLDESTIRNVVESHRVMHGQCSHLLTVGKRPNVRIQVAPSWDGSLIRPKASMSIIKLPDGHEWVYTESLDRGHFSDDPAVVARHVRTYDVLRADCLSATESAAFISEAMERYGRDEDRSGRGSLDQEQLQRPRRRQLYRSRPRIPRQHPRP